MDDTMKDLMWVIALALRNSLGYYAILESAIICVLLIVIYFMNKRLRSRKAHFRWVMQASGLYLFEYDGQHDEIWFSPQCARLLEVPELVRSFSHVSDQTKNSTLRRGLACVRKVMACTKENTRLEILKPDGRMGIFDARCESFCDEDGKQLSCVGILTDVTHEVREQEALDSEGGRDEVTGVFHAGTTRFLVERRMREQKPKLTGAFVLVDIMGLESFQTACGDEEVNAFLKALAQNLLETIRGNDILGRFADDQFSVYISNRLSYDTLYGCCMRLNKAAASSLTDAARKCNVQISVGGVMIHKADDIRSVLARAEAALKVAKVQGDESCCVMD